MLRAITEPWTYPGVKFFLLLGAGIAIGDAALIEGPALFPVLLAAIAVLGAAAFLPQMQHTPLLRQTSIALAVLLLGVALQHHALRSIDSSCIPFADTDGKQTVQAVVSGEPELRPGGYACDISCIEINPASGGTKVGGRARFFFNTSYGTAEKPAVIPVRGDTIIANGKLRTPNEATVPGGFDYRAFLNRQGITVSLHAYGNDAVRVRSAGSFSLWQPVHALRMFAYRSIERFAPQQRGILIALLLGDRGLLEPQLMDAFRTSGIVHILAVSGLHTGIILLMFSVLFMRIPLAWRVPLIIVGLLLYAMATGLAPPVVRASLIAVVFLVGLLLQRTSPPVNAIAVAGAAILLFDSQALFTLSFQLSFVAVFSIALFYKPIDGVLKKWPPTERYAPLRAARGLTALTLAAQAGTAPVILSTFGGISIVSLLSNLFAVPLAFFIVVISIAGLCLHAVLPLAGGWLLTASGAAADLLVTGSVALARIPFAEIHPGAPPLWIWPVYVFLLMYLGFATASLRVKLVTATATLAAAVVAFLLVSSMDDAGRGFEIAFLDVGQGDATLITTPEGGAILIDAGPNFGGTDAGRMVILPYLRMRGIARLQALILTHADGDHIGGAETVLAGIDVDTVYYSGISIVKSTTRDLDSVITLRNVPVKAVFAGDRINAAPDARFYVLAPPKRPYPAEADNDASIVVLAVYGNTTALFTGDADIGAEAELVQQYGSLIDADVLKIGHHGSASSSARAFLEAVSPDFAVISCGRNNRYKHPARRVREALSGANIATYRTDVHGTVLLSSDGERFAPILWNQ